MRFYLSTLLAVVLSNGGPASGAPLLVETVSYSVFGDAAATHVYLVDWDRGRVVPGGPNFYNAKPAGPPVLIPGQRMAVVPIFRVVAAPTPSFASLELRIVDLVPPRSLALALPERADSAPIDWARMLPESASGGALLWRTARRLPTQNANLTSHSFLRINDSTAALSPGRQRFVTGRPVDVVRWGSGGAVALSEKRAVFVLTRLQSGTTGAVGRELEQEISYPSEAVDAQPMQLALSRDRHLLFVTVQGMVRDERGQSALWVYALDSETFRVLGEPLRVVGKPVTMGLLPRGPDACAVVTESNQPPARHITMVSVQNDTLAPASIRSFARTGGPLPVLSPIGDAFLFGSGQTLWRSGGDGQWETLAKFEALIGSVTWTEEGVFVGEGHRLHRLDSGWQSQSSISLPKGRIQHVVALPAGIVQPDDLDLDGLALREERQLSASTENPDSDGDGVPDGLDTRPIHPARRAGPSDREQVTVSATRRGGDVFALGANLRLDRVESIYPGQSLPEWLQAREVQSLGATALQLSAVDLPVNDAVDLQTSTTVLIHAQDIYSKQWLYQGGIPLTVHLERPDREPRRILWVLPEDIPSSSKSEQRRASPTMERLAATPHRFSHRYSEGPVEQSLSQYAVIVADVATAARGILTRQYLSDYVRAGGGLLLVLENDVDPSEEDLVRFWLEAFGASLVPRPQTADDVTPVHLTRDWPQVPGAQRHAFHLDSMGDSLVEPRGESGACVLGVRLLGLGRVVFLSEPEALWGNSRNRDLVRRFTGSLFEHLATRDFGSRDSDGDGLANALEDVNKSGAWEPGETDLLRADSDGDGVSDGLEDWNGNGQWDEGETHGLNPDSDADGIPDGADGSPLPSVGTPVLSAVSPAEGPAEGGGAVTIHGQNLPANGKVFFGNIPASRVQPLDRSRMIAFLPGLPKGRPVGPVDVRIETSTETAAELPGGYTYTTRNRAELSWAELRAIAHVYDGYAGQVALHLDALGNDVTRAQVWIAIEPGGTVKLADWQETAALGRSGGSAIVESYSPGIYRIEFSGLHRGDSGIPLMLLDYRANFSDSQSDRLRFAVRGARINTSFGGELDISMPLLELPLNAAKGSLTVARPESVP